MKKTVVELFAGVGGFRCGLNDVTLKDEQVQENGNWDFIWANQWEPATKAQEAFTCYTQRFNDLEKASNKDIRLVKIETEIPEHTLLVGGFPCQDYSVARSLANGKGIKGKKGVLWWQIDKILNIKKPPFVLLENVDRLLLSPAKQRGRDFGIMLRCFLENDYGVEWRIINAADYGMPQKRRRVFIFAFHKSTKYYQMLEKQSLENVISESGIFIKQFPAMTESIPTSTTNLSKAEYPDLMDVNNNFKMQFYNAGVMMAGQVFTAKLTNICEAPFPLKKLIQTEPVDDTYFLSEHQLEKFKFMKGSKKIPRVKPNGEAYFYAEGAMPFPDNLEGPARTMLTSESSINRSTHVVKDINTGNLRFITPLEAERINGFPENWTNTGMSNKKRYFMMGNALVVNVVKKIGNEIEKIIENEN